MWEKVVSVEELTALFSLVLSGLVKENHRAASAILRETCRVVEDREESRVIHVSNVTRSFGTRQILRGVSLQVNAGEVCALIGRSGCGKSTLLRIINGLESHDGGEVWVEDTLLPSAAGRDRDRALLRIRQRVGMVFQKCHLFPHRTVLQNITEAPIHVLKRPPLEAAEEAQALLARVGLADKAHASPEALSGGEQQRVAIARTLAMKPRLILLDEPTSALDPRSAAEVAALLQELAEQGQGMIVVSHTPSFVRSIAGTVCSLHEGRVVEFGSASEVLGNPRHESTREFLKSA